MNRSSNYVLLWVRNTVFKLVFPTKDYVINHTHGGVEFASTLFLRSMAYSKSTFPKVY